MSNPSISSDPAGYFRKVIRITAADSPSVRRGLKMQMLGLEPDGLEELPGVLTWQEYVHRRATWDERRQTVGLDAAFYRGQEVLLFPPDWLARAVAIAKDLRERSVKRQAKGMGMDSAAGGNSSVWAVVDELGLMYMHSIKTPDTTAIPRITIDLMKQFYIAPERIMFDPGGGGKEHADRLRLMGYPVQTVAFGESVSVDLKRSMTQFQERRDVAEERQACLNRRAQMYWDLRQLLDPNVNPKGFGIPNMGHPYQELHRQMAPLPLWYDDKNRMYLPPKRRKDGDREKESVEASKVVTIESLIGCSPDEVDALVMSVWAMQHRVPQSRAGVV